MRYFRWLSLAIALLFCLSTVIPTTAQAAAQHKTAKKSSAAKASKKASAKSAKNSKSEKKTVAKSSKKPETKADDDRALWQKRAKESAALSGIASWYGKDFHNKPTASGLDYDMYTFTAAHRTLPLGTVVKVTDASNGKSVMVCVTDRGPYVKGRIIDLSSAAAQKLDLKDRGVSKVKLEVVSDETGAPLNGNQAYFVRYAAGDGKKTVGPFAGFADASAMREALGQAHPEAEVIIESAAKPK